MPRFQRGAFRGNLLDMRLTLRRRVLGLIAAAVVGTSVAVASTPARAAVTVDQFLAQTYADGMGHTLPYRLFVPAGYDAGAGPGKFGLVVYLHGAGGRGTDNRGQLGDQMAQMVFVQPENQARWPVFLLAPQCPPGVQWVSMPWGDASGKGKQPAAPTWPMTATMALLDKLLAQYPGIDPSRLYVTGVSMGGYGAWDAAVRYPSRWRAAVPICGGYDETKVAPLVGLPLWAFHAADDPTVPVARTRDLIAALRDLGGNPRYTEFPASAHYGHASWNPAYAEPLLLPWMFDGVDPTASVDGGSALPPPVVLDGGARGDVAADLPPPSSGAGGAGGPPATGGGAGGATAVATSPDSGTVGSGGEPGTGGRSPGPGGGLPDTAGVPGTGGASGPGTGLSRDAAAGSPTVNGGPSSPSDSGCACTIGRHHDDEGTSPSGELVAIVGLVLGGLSLPLRRRCQARAPGGAAP